MTLFSWTRASFTAVLFIMSLPIFGQTVLIQNGTASSCGGFFTDSGGNAAGYNPNENFTFTLCPDGTTGTHVQLIFSGVELGAGDVLTFYDGDMVDPTTQFMIDIVPGAPFIVQATAVNPTGCLTITFTSDGAGESSGWSADINCIPACQLIQSILVSSDPVVEPVDTGYVDACPGQRVFFTGEGMYPQNGIIYNHSDFTSDFFWDFGDGNNAVGPNVSHTYEEPGGYIVQLTITDQFGCTNTNFISQRVRISPSPTFAVGGQLDSEVCAGDTVYLNAVVDTINSANNVSVVTNPGSFQSGGVRSDSLPLPDGTGAVYETSINFTEFAPGQVLENINDLEGICVVMEHSWLFDLDVFLTCPDGTQIILQNQEFIGNEVFLGEPFEADDIGTPNPPGQGVGYEYCWTPNATNGTWTEFVQQFDPQTLPSDDYSAFQDMSALVGCPLNGEWSIIVQDQWGSDNGWIFEWSINLNANLYPSIETFTPSIIDFAWENNPSIFYYSLDSIAAAPQNAGTANYTFEVTNEFGCTYDTTVNFAVLPITHPDCYNCADNITQIEDVIICEGESTLLDVSANVSTENTVMFEVFPLYPLGFFNHPPANPYPSGIEVNSVAPTIITDPLVQIESVCINMLTDWNADIAFILRAPSGELLELSTNNGGGLDNYTNTCFTPDAATSITAGTPPFTGNFQPEGNWNSLVGANILGEWQLLVSDQFGINDVGEFVSWSISFNSVNDVQYMWTPSVGLSCTECPDPVASPSSSTTYTINYEDSYGCTFVDEIQVNVINDVLAPNVNCQILTPDSGELVFNWTQVGAFTNYELNIISSVSGESGWFGPVNGLSYTLSGLQNNEEIILQVRVFVGGSGSCIIEIGETTCIYDSCELEGSIDAIQAVSCFGDTNGEVVISAIAGVPPFQFYIDGNPTAQNSGIFTGLSSGMHFVTIRDAMDCEELIEFVIPQPDELTATVEINQAILCFNDQDGELEAIPSGGNGGFSFEWSNGEISAINQPLDIGTYTVTITDQLGCTSEGSITLTQPDELMIELIKTDVSCIASNDGSIQVNALGGTITGSGGYTYTWDDGTGNTAFNENLGSGTYCVTVTDESGCQVEECIEIEVPSALVVQSISGTDVLCNGGNTGTTTVNAVGGTGMLTYLWNDPLAQVSTTATNLEAGDYTVTITDENGCTTTADVSISEPALLEVTANAIDVLCRGESEGSISSIVIGGLEPYEYNWNVQGQTSDLTEIPAGDYSLTVTDANGCTAEVSISVEEPDTQIDLSVEQTRLGCYGQMDSEAMVTPIGGTAPFNYNWSDGQNTPTAIGLDTTSYFVIVEDANGCTAETSIILTELDSIFVNIIPNSPNCFGYNDGAMAINLVDGGLGSQISDYTFNWSNSQSGEQINNLLGDMMYAVTATDAQGCIGTAFQVLSQPPPVTFEIDSTATSCFGFEDGTATVLNMMGAGMTFDVQWDANANNQSGIIATDLASGTYIVSVTDEDGCEATGSIFIPQPTDVVVELSTIDNICFGEFAGQVFTEVNGGVPGYTFDWSTGSTDSRVDGLAAGTYIVTVTDAQGCIEEVSAEILQPDILLADIATVDVSCFGGRDGRFIVSPNGGTPPYQYSLDNKDYNGASTIVGLTQGEYNVFIKDDNGCIFFEDMFINEPEEFMVLAGIDERLVLGDSIQLLADTVNAQGSVEFVWSAPYEGTLSCIECPDPWVVTQNTIMYELYGIDENGCEDTDLITVFIEKPRTVLVATGFSPNGDFTNDRLYVHGRTGTIIKSFKVFDRWGQLLFENADFEVNDPAQGWDGSYRGEIVSSGVYIWYIEAEYIDGAEEVFKGQTTVIR